MSLRPQGGNVAGGIEGLSMSSWRDDPKADLAVRLAVAIPAAVAGMVILVQGLRMGAFAAAGAMLVAAACFVLAGIMIAPWVAERVGNAGAGVLYPDRHFAGPQAIFSLAEGKRAQGLPRDALTEYERVLAEHPDEVGCFVAMMDIAARDLHDPVLAEGFYRRGNGQLTDPEARQQLREAHDEILKDFQSPAP